MGQLDCCRGCCFWEEWATGGRQPWGRAPCFFVRGRNGEKEIREAGKSQRATLTGGEGVRQRGNGGRIAFVLCAEVCYNRNEKPYGRAA